MLDLIKKTLLTSVGLAVMTKDKVEELGKELIEKGNVSEKEGKELMDELLKKSEQTGKDLEAKIEEVMRKTVNKLNVATKDDIAKLTKKIKHLESLGRREN